MTFGEIRAFVLEGTGEPPGGKLHPPLERSIRRALHRLVSDGLLVAIGEGGPGDPFRYFIGPMVIGTMGDTSEAKALGKALEAAVLNATRCRGFGF